MILPGVVESRGNRRIVLAQHVFLNVIASYSYWGGVVLDGEVAGDAVADDLSLRGVPLVLQVPVNGVAGERSCGSVVLDGEVAADAIASAIRRCSNQDRRSVVLKLQIAGHCRAADLVLCRCGRKAVDLQVTADRGGWADGEGSPVIELDVPTNGGTDQDHVATALGFDVTLDRGTIQVQGPTAVERHVPGDAATGEEAGLSRREGYVPVKRTRIGAIASVPGRWNALPVGGL